MLHDHKWAAAERWWKDAGSDVRGFEKTREKGLGRILSEGKKSVWFKKGIKATWNY